MTTPNPRSIQPRDDGCLIYFHPTTAKVLQAIEDLLGDGYSATWADVARKAGVSLSTVRRHRAALESVNYIECGEYFGDTLQMMSLNEPIEYDCADMEVVE